MKRNLLAIAITLTAFLTSYSQSVVEEKTRAFFDRNDLVTEIEIKSEVEVAVPIRLELIDRYDQVNNSVEQTAKLQKGANRISLRMTYGNTRDVDDLLWRRLRYTVGSKTGIVSLSQAMPDMFEIRAGSPEYVASGSTFTVGVITLNPISKKPVPNVELKATFTMPAKSGDSEKPYGIEAEAVTDASGFATLLFQVPNGVEFDRWYSAGIRIEGTRNGLRVNAKDSIGTLSNNLEVLLNIDKPLYQPGQTIFVRGLAAERTDGKAFGKPRPDEEIEFVIEDEEDLVLYRETVKTSRFGIASINWQIPDNAKLGKYSITAEFPEAGKRSYASFKVSRYELPNFFVNTKPDKDYYLALDKTAKVKVDATYLFGKPVAKGKVRVARETEREWNFEEQKWEISEEEEYTGETRDDGFFEAKIDLRKAHKELADEEDERFSDLSYTAYFTDSTTNITEERRFDLRVSKEDIHVYFVGLSDSDRNPNFPLRFFVTTTLADGTPIAADVNIEARYQDYKKLVQKTKVKTNKYGAARVELKLPPCPDEACYEDIDLSAEATDAVKRKGRYTREITVDDDETELFLRPVNTIIAPGRPIEIEVFSSAPTPLVLVNILSGLSSLSFDKLQLNRGYGRLTVPYRPEFKGPLIITAAFEYGGDAVRATGGIIYPSPVALDVKSETDKEIYRPASDVSLKYAVGGPDGSKSENALGVYILDRAVEERALSDSNFGGGFDSFSSFRRALDDYGAFGGLSLRDINALDPAKPFKEDVQLAAALMLDPGYKRIDFFDTDLDSPSRVFADLLAQQMRLVSIPLNYRYSVDFVHPTDYESLDRLLKENKIDFAGLRDPWGVPYRAEFSVSQEKDVLRVITNGPDKKPNVPGEWVDDFTVIELGWNYFTETGQKIDKAVAEYNKKTGKFVRDRKLLDSILLEQGVDLASMKDRWGRPYEITFGAEYRNYKIEISSLGYDTSLTYDDFEIWQTNTDYFAAVDNKINNILTAYINETKSFPANVDEFKTILIKGGVDFDGLHDGWGRPYYIEFNVLDRFADKVTIESEARPGEASAQRYVIKPVTQTVATFSIRSYGETGEKETYEWRKPRIASYRGIVAEQPVDKDKPDSVVPTSVLSDGNAAVWGTVTDSQGAVIPGATVSAESTATGGVRTATSDDSGVYVIGRLPAGEYRLRISFPGFNTLVVNGVNLRSGTLVKINGALEVGGISAMVEVQALGELTVDSSNASISTTREGYVPGTRANQSALMISGGVLNGASGKEVNFIIDGQEVSNFRTGALNVVTRSGRGEFEAEYGGATGGATGDNQRKETPRVRNYFPETLLWAPEIVTDENGNATIKFKLADSITTWRIYAIASNLEGRIGVSEKEIKTFQPFFVDLLPPRILTIGDEIALPVQVRNYTDKTQDVEVSLRGESWFDTISQISVRTVARAATPKPPASPDSAMLNVATNVAGKDGASYPVPLARIAMTENGFSPVRDVKVAPNSSENAVFDFRATKRVVDGVMNVMAVAGEETDAIEKPVTVKPDGREMVDTQTRIFKNLAAFDVNFPSNALPGTNTAELKIYPNLYAHVAESIGGLLQRPYGCGEQTVSLTYPNLMVLKFAGPESELGKAAKLNLQKGYERLLGYRSDGGFSYWGGKDPADIALTAYALTLLSEASEFIDVDDSVISEAKTWLVAQQKSNGSWNTAYFGEREGSTARGWQISTYVVRALAATAGESDSSNAKTALETGLLFLGQENKKINEPYSLANLGLAYLAVGDDDKARKIAEQLRKLAIPEGDGVYWNLETNTPFFGWGTAGRIETTALVVQLLQKTKGANDAENEELISRGTSFLLKNKDRYGVWHSTQATINVLDALLLSIGRAPERPGVSQTASVYVNGEKIRDIKLPPANEPTYPVTFDISTRLSQSGNDVEMRTDSGTAMQAQVVARHYLDWDDVSGEGRDFSSSRQIALDYSCDKYDAKPTEEISCRVKAERVGFKGYGMLLAEIGLPPGADVDRASLDRAKAEDWSFSRYDVLPDRIVIYMWSKAGGTEFGFKFKPRYGLNAQTPASSVYDYYNEEAKAVVKPMRFVVR